MQLMVTWKKHLFDDNLHLLGSGICTLATNFICNLNFFYGKIYTIQTYISNQQNSKHQKLVSKAKSQSLDLQIFDRNRLKYPKNPIIVYLE